MKRRNDGPEDDKTNDVNGVKSEEFSCKLRNQKHRFIGCKLYFSENIFCKQVTADKEENVGKVISKCCQIAVES